MKSLKAPAIKVTLLGTGTSSGVPMIGCQCEVCTSADPKDNRLRTSILIESDTTRFVIDTTPDFRYQMLREDIRTLDAVLFTHPHKDHTAGLDDVRAFNYFQNRAMEVYANRITIEALKREFDYVFAEHRYPGIPQLDVHEVTEESFSIGDIPVRPIKVWHLRMPVFGYRIGDFAYITDANRIDEEEKKKLKGSKVIIVNALRKEKHISHFTLQEAIDLVEELGIPEAYFTHISHQMGKHADVESQLPAGIHLGFDGQRLNISAE